MARTSKLPPKFETEVGQPSILITAPHTTADSARGRIIGAVETLQKFGANFNSDLERQCVATIEQIKDLNPKTLPLHETREWQVTDAPSGLTLIVKLRRIA